MRLLLKILVVLGLLVLLPACVAYPYHSYSVGYSPGYYVGGGYQGGHSYYGGRGGYYGGGSGYYGGGHFGGHGHGHWH